MAHNLCSSAQMIGLFQLSLVAEKFEQQMTSARQPAELDEAVKALALRIDEGAAALRGLAPIN